MTDRQWLRAMQRYSIDKTTFFSETGPVGGAGQLASQLEAQTKDDPERFMKLLLMMPDDINPAYPQAVLRGLREAPADIEYLLPCTARAPVSTAQQNGYRGFSSRGRTRHCQTTSCYSSQTLPKIQPIQRLTSREHARREPSNNEHWTLTGLPATAPGAAQRTQ